MPLRTAEDAALVSRVSVVFALLAVLAGADAVTAVLQRRDEPDRAVHPSSPRSQSQAVNGPIYPRVRFRASRAIGLPHAGRLVRGTQLPSRGPGFNTWDPITRESPSHSRRRFGTDDLVRMVLRVARRYRAAEPGALPMLVGDLSRPRGGDFGPQYGFIGHATHQNGLDVDVYYPRRDGRRTVPETPAQVNRRLSQRLVDLFVAAGAQTVLVGPNVALRGPPGVVKPFPNHDNHLHVRIRNPEP